MNYIYLPIGGVDERGGGDQDAEPLQADEAAQGAISSCPPYYGHCCYSSVHSHYHFPSVATKLFLKLQTDQPINQHRKIGLPSVTLPIVSISKSQVKVHRVAEIEKKIYF